MKKIICGFLTLILFACVAPKAFASCDYTKYCVEPYDLSSGFSKYFCKFTGTDLVVNKLVQSILKKELKKSTREKFEVELDSFSTKDLSEGRFKSLSISGKDLEIEGIYLSSLDIITICDFNYIDMSDKSTIRFKENLLMQYDIVISQNDLNKTMDSAGYMAMLNTINITGLNKTLVRVQNAKAQIKNERLYFVIPVYSSFLNIGIPFNLVMSAGIKVVDGKIALSDVTLENTNNRLDLRMFNKLLNTINPLNFTLEIFEGANTETQVKNIKIVDDKILIDGIIFIPKNSKN